MFFRIIIHIAFLSILLNRPLHQRGNKGNTNSTDEEREGRGRQGGEWRGASPSPFEGLRVTIATEGRKGERKEGEGGEQREGGWRLRRKREGRQGREKEGHGGRRKDRNEREKGGLVRGEYDE